jgi:hypothetical protein
MRLQGGRRAPIYQPFLVGSNPRLGGSTHGKPLVSRGSLHIMNLQIIPSPVHMQHFQSMIPDMWFHPLHLPWFLGLCFFSIFEGKKCFFYTDSYNHYSKKERLTFPTPRRIVISLLIC